MEKVKASPAKRLYEMHDMPEHFKEKFIVSGYRYPKSSFTQCMLSVFKPTNETLNFWTHFLPAVYFCYRLYLFTQELDFLHDAYTFPLLTYMITLCLFPFTSAVAHLFNTMSDKARHICFFLDYLALSQFTVGGAMAYNTYIFPEALMEGIFHSTFLNMGIINGAVSLTISCQTRFMKNGFKKKLLRIGAYAMPYFYHSMPVFYRIFLCQPHECKAPALSLHTSQFILAFFGVMFYLSHWPERSFPRRFDVFGHSHQLFHICTAGAAFLQMTGLLLDLKHRKDYLLIHHNIPSVAYNILLMITIGAISIVILFYYVHKLYHVKPEDDCWVYLYGEHKAQSKGICGRSSSIITNGNTYVENVHLKSSKAFESSNFKSRNVILKNISGKTAIDSDFNGDYGSAAEHSEANVEEYVYNNTYMESEDSTHSISNGNISRRSHGIYNSEVKGANGNVKH